MMFNNSNHYQSFTHDLLNTVKRNPKIKLSQFREHIAKLIGLPSHNAVKQHIDKACVDMPTTPLTPYEMFLKCWPFIINNKGWGCFYASEASSFSPCDEIHYTDKHDNLQLEFDDLKSAPAEVSLEHKNSYVIVDNEGEKHFVRFFAPVELKAPKKLSNTFNPMSLINSPTLQANAPVITAEAHSDDRKVEVSFDASKYFLNALIDGDLEKELCRLKDCDFGGDYPADEVAQFFFESTTKRISDYLNFSDGFECNIDVDSVKEWLKQYAPDLLSVLEGESVDTVTVIVVKDDEVQDKISFPETRQGNLAAEKCFVGKMAQHISNFDEYSSGDIQACLDDGYEGFGNGSISIVHDTE